MRPSRLLFIFLLAIISIDARPQQSLLDSLKNLLNQTTNDSIVCNIYVDMADSYGFSEPDSSLIYLHKALEIAIRNKYEKHHGYILANIGIMHHIKGEFEMALDNYFKSLVIREKLDDKLGAARAYNNIGIIYRNQSNFAGALDVYEKAIVLLTDLERYGEISKANNNIALVYYDQGNYDKAIEYLFKALEFTEKTGDVDGMAMAYNNIGSIYQMQGSLEVASEYYLKSLKNREEAGDKKGMAASYNNLGNVSYDMKEYAKALDYHHKSLKFKQDISDKLGMSASYTNIGNVHRSLKNYGKAIENYQKALKIDQELGDIQGQAIVYNNIANLHLAIADSVPGSNFEENIKASVEYGEKSYKLALQIGALPVQNNTSKGLLNAYKRAGNYKEALKYAEIFIETNGIMFNDEKTQALTEMQTKYETEKKQLEIANLNNQNALQLVELERSEERRKKQLTIIYSFVAGFILIVIFSAIILKLFIEKKKANILLAEQKSQIELKNAELFQANEEIMAQRDMVMEQKDQIEMQNAELYQANEEILAQRDEIESQRDMVMEQMERIEFQKKKIDDSIRYAQRIQEAVVPSEVHLSKLIDDHFVIFRPKDVVSGDFYWATQVNQWLVITVSDCTGHGVPGAFMSMLGVSFLNEIVRKKEIVSPAQILEDLRKAVIDALGQTSDKESQKDGMDMSLAAINLETRECKWAGAGNSLWLVRNDSVGKQPDNPIDMVEVIKGDNMPVAINTKMYDFSEHSIQLVKGDRIYLLSDGIIDQFGGPTGRKFMSKQLKQIIASMATKPLAEQKMAIEEALDNWMNASYEMKFDQVDDITVLGISI
jgi:serine phosphatase RsbU (regulator of sigma subunit)/Tfp pilus assembly protein PilF